MFPGARYNPFMPNVEKHAPGTFCWIELAATDQEAAKKFYCQLFPWSISDVPMGPSGNYTMFQIDGRSAAAAYTITDEMRSEGVPPHWDLYVSVENADDAARRATELGGKVIAGPFDVMDYGRMAVLLDPAGAVFCVWQPKSGIGIYVTAVPGTLCWADLSTPDQVGSAAFYSGLFGWTTMFSENDPSGYLHIKAGENFIGGIPPARVRDPKTRPHWLAYFYVSDVDASAAKVKDLGGAVHLAPMNIPNAGRMAIVADPQGAVFAIFQPPAQRQ